jgi:hypothetical protein
MIIFKMSDHEPTVDGNDLSNSRNFENDNTFNKNIHQQERVNNSNIIYNSGVDNSGKESLNMNIFQNFQQPVQNQYFQPDQIFESYNIKASENSQVRNIPQQISGQGYNQFGKIPGNISSYNDYKINDDIGFQNTQVFMKNVDICCEDHQNNHNICNVDAIRFCTRCKVLCCSDCVIEYHNEHIQEAKMKIEEYFSSMKSELESIKSANNANLESKEHLTEVYDKQEEMLKHLNTFIDSRVAKFDTLKKEIDESVKELVGLREKVKENINKFYDNECFKRIERPIKNLENSKWILYLFILFSRS